MPFRKLAHVVSPPAAAKSRQKCPNEEFFHLKERRTTSLVVSQLFEGRILRRGNG